jgi:glycosyltransferase involved in cell wall biosynthesis
LKASVIIPCRNMARFVVAAVRSILDQGHGDVEVIVVDDGSTDGSADAVGSVRDGRVRLIRTPGEGVAAAFNRGLAQAKGEITMKCDADDLYPMGRMRFQSDFLQRRPDVDVVSGYMSFVWADGTPIIECRREAGDGPLNDEILAGNFPNHLCAMAFRTSVLRGLGGARTYFESAEDLDLLARAAERHLIWHVQRHAYINRLHGSSMTRTTSRARLQWYVDRAIEFQQQRRHGGVDMLAAGDPPRPPSEFPPALSRRPSEAAAELLTGDAWARVRCGDAIGAVRSAVRAFQFRPGRTSAAMVGKVAAKALLS